MKKILKLFGVDIEHEINLRDDVISMKDDEIQRLVATINALNSDNRRLKQEIRDGKPILNYNFTPENLTSEEQELIGKYSDSEILDLISKWLLHQCETNNDLLVHSCDESMEKQALWKASVRVYEDWYQFLKFCKAC